MSKKNSHVSETPATQLLKANQVAFTEHPYDYLEHGGAQHSAAVLGLLVAAPGAAWLSGRRAMPVLAGPSPAPAVPWHTEQCWA